MRTYKRISVVLFSATFLAICGGVTYATGILQPHIHSDGLSDNIAGATTPPSTVVYAVPSSDAAGPQIFSRALNTSDAPIALGFGYAADTLPSTGNSQDFVVYGVTHSPSIFNNSSSGSPTAVSLSGADVFSQQGSVLLTSGDDIYVQEPTQYLGSSDVAEIDTTSGAVVARFALPRLSPDSVAGTLPTGYSGLDFGPTVGSIASLILDDGNLYALQFTGRAAAIDNLTNGDTESLAGYGDLGGGALGADGDIYVVAWRQNTPSDPFNVLRIDPSSLAVVSSTSTGLDPPTTLNVEVQGNASENALIYISQGSVSTPIDSYIWSATSNGLQSLGSLPANVGLYMSDFGSTVYLYGGPAKNAVSSLDLNGLSLTQDVVDMSTPTGTYVLALN